MGFNSAFKGLNMLYCQLLDNDIKCEAQTRQLPVFLSLLYENQNIGFQYSQYRFTIGGIDTRFNLAHNRNANCKMSYFP
jgi:hypothetical protein